MLIHSHPQPSPDQIAEARFAARTRFERVLAHARSAALDQADRLPNDRSWISTAFHDRYGEHWRTELTDQVFAEFAQGVPGLILTRHDQPGVLPGERQVTYYFQITL